MNGLIKVSSFHQNLCNIKNTGITKLNSKCERTIQLVLLPHGFSCKALALSFSLDSVCPMRDRPCFVRPIFTLEDLDNSTPSPDVRLDSAVKLWLSASRCSSTSELTFFSISNSVVGVDPSSWVECSAVDVASVRSFSWWVESSSMWKIYFFCKNFSFRIF